ncbi:hypothetical protein FN976_26020 [Caenimonas sedimenti]|uniref:Uncharacterized protein n=1 Tax=Caenimonas sedimenti TaxID=2596921 RepID=A0A562ZGZ5_9BURK|nr:hypothetical protein [Caenimonas sedimenti]TWO66991.1 hypothetical protein FN976_26020 [Caenimonas sedimenti]
MRTIAISLDKSGQSRLRAHPLLEQVLRTMVPSASPDFEKAYSDVRHWWIEVDETGLPQREIGFSISEQAIVAGPLGRNMGFWTDSPMLFDDPSYEEVSPQAFEDEWAAFLGEWERNRPSAS